MIYTTLETASEIAGLSIEKYENFSGDTTTLQTKIDALVLKNKRARPEEQFRNNKILRAHLRYGPQPVSDDLIAKIKKQGKGKNGYNMPFDWFVVSVDATGPEVPNDERLEGSDLFFNHAFENNLSVDRGYRIKCFTANNEVVVIEDHVNAYFQEIFKNWAAYKAALKKQEVEGDYFQLIKRLKAASVADLVKEAKEFSDDQEEQTAYFVGKASERYKKSFIHKQECHKAKSLFADSGYLDVFAYLNHILDAGVDMKYMVLADIFEKRESWTISEERKSNLCYITQPLHTEVSMMNGMNLDNPEAIEIIDEVSDGLLKKLKAQKRC